MSYVGYVIEEIMHGRQAEVERHAADYLKRQAARSGRRSSRRVPARRVGPTARPAAASGSVEATC